jgi:type I restriction enzyme S subunit
VPGLNRNDAYPIPVLVPDLAEQACIAEVLDTLDEAIRGTECLISKLETMRSGVLSQLVFPWLGDSGEYPPDLMMASRSLLLGRGLLPAGWEWVRLETIAEVERGKFTYRPRNEPKLFGGSFPFIQTGDVVRALGREINTASQWLNEMGMRFSREFPAGTIAVTIAANIADTAILGIPMCFPDSVVGVVVRKPHNNRFVELCIRVAKLGLEARAPQSAQKNINLQDLRPLWIPLPPPERQERIAVAYEAHESRIRDEATRLEKLRGIKSGLTSDLLTGRVRTPPR